MDPNETYSAMTTAMSAGKHVTARLLALELWHWLSTGGAYPNAPSGTVDATLRGVMLSTEFLEAYDGWENDIAEDTGEKIQGELF